MRVFDLDAHKWKRFDLYITFSFHLEAGTDKIFRTLEHTVKHAVLNICNMPSQPLVTSALTK